MVNKIDDIYATIKSNDCDIVSIPESWLSSRAVIRGRNP